jgi:hypothetical protein
MQLLAASPTLLQTPYDVLHATLAFAVWCGTHGPRKALHRIQHPESDALSKAIRPKVAFCSMMPHLNKQFCRLWAFQS